MNEKYPQWIILGGLILCAFRNGIKLQCSKFSPPKMNCFFDSCRTTGQPRFGNFSIQNINVNATSYVEEDALM